jgi:drug/metabolite transporter (DMT)-like permease
MAPNGVTFTRIAIGFLTLSLFPSARKPVARADWAGTAALGVLWLAFPLSMFPFAEQHVSSALTGMLNGATPLCVAAVATVIARRLPQRGVLLGLVVGFGGAVLMALPAMGGSGESSGSAFGVALIGIAIVSYGIALNIARPLQQRNGAIPIIWRALGVAVVLTAPLGLPAVLNAHWTWRAALSMACLGAGGTAIAHILTATAAGRLGATKASATAFLMPVIALVLGVVLLGEQVTVVSLVGAAICLLGAAIIRDPKMFAPLLPGRLMRVVARI